VGARGFVTLFKPCHNAVQLLWSVALASIGVRFSRQLSHLHAAAFHAAWGLALIGLLFFIKAQLLHKTLLQRQQCRKTLLAVIALLCMGVGAAGSAQIVLMRHSHVQMYHPAAAIPSAPSTTVDRAISTWSFSGPDALAAGASEGAVSSQISWQSDLRHHRFPAEERYANIAQVVLALVCTVSASMSAHGAAGYILHHHATDKARASTWAFFQPFRGGATFIAVQFLGWTLFSIEVLGLLHAALAVARGFVIPKHWWLLAAGMLFVPVLLAVSPLSFQERKKRDAETRSAQAASGQHEIPFMRR
jgi:hypothetical protein